ncbi:MAG: TetR/AcrR family transcriptional regulator [Candidatus Latescibacterota bacterium]|nr:MAG: TetR/AcrR family transcriptional regulator [Candidatus Latescibacterota bacterium]
MGTAERREREKEQRRNDIIDAAEKVFFSKGMPNATMEEVAEAAELSKGTIYLYFKNKEDLYLAIILRGIAILQEMFEKAVASHDTGLAKIEAVGRSFFSFCNTHPDYFQAMLYFESSGEPAGEEATAGYAVECQAQSVRTLEICAQAVQKGIDDGTLRSDLDPTKTAMTLYGMSVGLLQIVCMKRSMLEDEHKVDPDELIEYFFEFVMHSLIATEPESHA